MSDAVELLDVKRKDKEHLKLSKVSEEKAKRNRNSHSDENQTPETTKVSRALRTCLKTVSTDEIGR